MWSFVAVLAVVAACVAGHGRVFQPPSRASAWRFGFGTPADYDDDGANCGGFAVQHAANRGKCGICGDAYNIPPPRPYELGGVYGQGVLVAGYLPGSLMTTTVDLTTSHRGFWEFKLCPDPENNEQPCFDRYVLEMENGGTKFYPDRGSAIYNVTYRLPKGLVCEHCVLQWRYTAGNNWGICENGTQGLGCGVQEQFGACSDIYIGTTKKETRVVLQNYKEPESKPSPWFFMNAPQGLLNMFQGIVRSPVDTKQPARKSNPTTQQQTQITLRPSSTLSINQQLTTRPTPATLINPQIRSTPSTQPINHQITKSNPSTQAINHQTTHRPTPSIQFITQLNNLIAQSLSTQGLATQNKGQNQNHHQTTITTQQQTSTGPKSHKTTHTTLGKTHRTPRTHRPTTPNDYTTQTQGRPKQRHKSTKRPHQTEKYHSEKTTRYPKSGKIRKENAGKQRKKKKFDNGKGYSRKLRLGTW